MYCNFPNPSLWKTIMNLQVLWTQIIGYIQIYWKKIKSCLCGINKLIQKLHFLAVGRGEYLYPFVAMQLFNNEMCFKPQFCISYDNQFFPRIFIVLSKHNFSESEFSRSPLKGN